jgi:ABC-type amino acid transport substrate-binding protein
MISPSAFLCALAAPTFVRRLAAAIVFVLSAGFAAAQDPPLKVAVYDAPPYGHLEPDGSVDGVSVDLWRRVAESLGREYHLVPVTQMEAILQGLERKDYDVAIGAIRPARLARVDFSYPTHRSGAAVAVRAVKSTPSSTAWGRFSISSPRASRSESSRLKVFSSPPIWRRSAGGQPAKETARRGPGRDHRKPGMAPSRGWLLRPPAIVTL